MKTISIECPCSILHTMREVEDDFDEKFATCEDCGELVEIQELKIVEVRGR